MLHQVLKMFIIFSSMVKLLLRGDLVNLRINSKLLVENFHTESLISLRQIHDHMPIYGFQALDLDIKGELLNFVSSGRKNYFQSQKEKYLANESLLKILSWLN